MQVITSIERAYQIALPYVTLYKDASLPQKTKITQVFKSHEDPVPKHATSSRWEMTPESLRNTLNYIFYKLAYNCYMLCVDNEGKKTLYKLESLYPSDRFRAAIENQLAKLDSNKLITESQREYIRKVASKPVRVLQCILKNYTDLGDRTETMNEFMKLLEPLFLPTGVFILNLSDAVILHRDNREPFPMVTGDIPIEQTYLYKTHLPIFSLSGQQKYADIPFPNYDDMFIVTEQKQVEFNKYVVDWDKKTIHKAVFRGGPSGCGYTAETNQRIRLVMMKSPLLDAKIVIAGKTTIDSNSIKFDPIHGLGMLNTGIPVGNFLDMVAQSKYKYIIHVDGNVNAYRLLTTMMTGSLIIRVDSPYISWVDHLLKPGRDYVLVKPDLSDLLAKIRWCEEHPNSARKMARNGYEFAKRVLNRDYVGGIIEKMFWSLPHMSRFSRVKTRKNKQKVMQKPKSPDFSPPELLSSKSEEPMIQKSEEPMVQKSEELMVQKSEEPRLKTPPIEYEIIEFPPNAKKCPNGYNSVTIKKKKMCRRKKNQTQKAE